jgi:hypothetical protein
MNKITYYLSDDSYITENKDALNFFFDCLFDIGIIMTENKKMIIESSLDGIKTKECFCAIKKVYGENSEIKFADILKNAKIERFLNECYE